MSALELHRDYLKVADKLSDEDTITCHMFFALASRKLPTSRAQMMDVTRIIEKGEALVRDQLARDQRAAKRMLLANRAWAR